MMPSEEIAELEAQIKRCQRRIRDLQKATSDVPEDVISGLIARFDNIIKTTKSGQPFSFVTKTISYPIRFDISLGIDAACETLFMKAGYTCDVRDEMLRKHFPEEWKIMETAQTKYKALIRDVTKIVKQYDVPLNIVWSLVDKNGIWH